jgi:hypothetical protein
MRNPLRKKAADITELPPAASTEEKPQGVTEQQQAAPAAAETKEQRERNIIEQAKLGPEPMTLDQATNEYLNRLDHIIDVKRKGLGDLKAIREQVQKFAAIGHPIMQQYCVPLHPEVEAHFVRKRAEDKAAGKK